MLRNLAIFRFAMGRWRLQCKRAMQPYKQIILFYLFIQSNWRRLRRRLGVIMRDILNTFADCKRNRLPPRCRRLPLDIIFRLRAKVSAQIGQVADSCVCDLWTNFAIWYENKKQTQAHSCHFLFKNRQ